MKLDMLALAMSMMAAACSFYCLTFGSQRIVDKKEEMWGLDLAFHIILWLLFSFAQCYYCVNSFVSIMKKIVGGE
jgi:hypothetical protein